MSGPHFGHHPKCYSQDMRCYCSSSVAFQLPPEPPITKCNVPADQIISAYRHRPRAPPQPPAGLPPSQPPTAASQTPHVPTNHARQPPGVAAPSVQGIPSAGRGVVAPSVQGIPSAGRGVVAPSVQGIPSAGRGVVAPSVQGPSVGHATQTVPSGLNSLSATQGQHKTVSGAITLNIGGGQGATPAQNTPVPGLPMGQQAPRMPVGQHVPGMHLRQHVPGMPMGQHMPRMPVGQQAPRMPVGQQAPRMPMGQQAPRMPVGQHMPGMPVGQQAPRMPMGQHMPGMPVGHQMPGMPVGQQVSRIPVGQQAPRMPVGHLLPGMPAGRSVAAVSAAHTPPPPSKGQTVREESLPQYKCLQDTLKSGKGALHPAGDPPLPATPPTKLAAHHHAHHHTPHASTLLSKTPDIYAILQGKGVPIINFLEEEKLLERIKASQFKVAERRKEAST